MFFTIKLNEIKLTPLYVRNKVKVTSDIKDVLLGEKHLNKN